MTDFFQISPMHLVGIKGVAMAALAQCLDDRGVRVTGSDLSEDFVTKDILAQRGFPITDGFHPAHVPDGCGLVVYTGAHQGKENCEVQEAISRGIPTMSHAEALGNLMQGKKGISICGTGGKSTTSAMIAWVLEYCGFRPSFAVGVGRVNNFGVSGRYTHIHSEQTDEISSSGWFVAEADEYAVDPTSDHRPRFIYQHPKIIVCTNLSYDHPDIYPSFEKMKGTFLTFFNDLEAGDLLVINTDCTALDALADKVRKDVHTLRVSRTEEHHIQLQFPGEHNQVNARLALAVALALGIERSKALEALEKFTGTMRRFEYKGMVEQMRCYDDYAHTPDEIRATLMALREWEPGKRIIAAFQPHTYSRTKALFDGFVESLNLADEVILLPIFASARESTDPSVSSKLLSQKILTHNSSLLTLDELAQEIMKLGNEHSVFITLGAGDIYKVYEHLQVD